MDGNHGHYRMLHTICTMRNYYSTSAWYNIARRSPIISLPTVGSCFGLFFDLFSYTSRFTRRLSSLCFCTVFCLHCSYVTSRHAYCTVLYCTVPPNYDSWYSMQLSIAIPFRLHLTWLIFDSTTCNYCKKRGIERHAFFNFGRIVLLHYTFEVFPWKLTGQHTARFSSFDFVLDFCIFTSRHVTSRHVTRRHVTSRPTAVLVTNASTFFLEFENDWFCVNTVLSELLPIHYVMQK